MRLRFWKKKETRVDGAEIASIEGHEEGGGDCLPRRELKLNMADGRAVLLDNEALDRIQQALSAGAAGMAAAMESAITSGEAFREHAKSCPDCAKLLNKGLPS